MGLLGEHEIDLHHLWPEYLSGFLLFLGLLLAIALRSKITSYLVVIGCGYFFGRLIYFRKHHEPILPFIMMTACFGVGYVIGSLFAQAFILMLLFVASFTGSYQYHLKKSVTSFKSKSFVR